MSSRQLATALLELSRDPLDDDSPKLSGSSRLESFYWSLHSKPITFKPKSSEPKSIELKLGVLEPEYSNVNAVNFGKAPAPNSIVLKLLHAVKIECYNYVTAPPNPAGNTIFCKLVQLANTSFMRVAVNRVPEPSGNSMLDKLVQ